METPSTRLRRPNERAHKDHHHHQQQLLPLPPAASFHSVLSLRHRQPILRNPLHLSCWKHLSILKYVFAIVVAVVGVYLYLLYLFLTKQYNGHDQYYNSSNVISPKSLVQSRKLTPLQPIDREQYTIRINTWRRLEQLQVSIQHHLTCPGVAAIQVVWCNDQGDPPNFLYENDLVHVERHSANNLNERFHIIDEPPTMGILSMDDDVLRPCDAIDAGFFKWVHHPDRMVGFDARSHQVDPDTGIWTYAYRSTTKKTNQYSLTLLKYAFLHRDYLDHYMTKVPPMVLQMVAKNFNCEDIAMSFFVSSLTHGKPPLLADYWAIDSMVKLYSPTKISASSSHKALRDECVDTFAQQYGLKNNFRTTKFIHPKHIMFGCGDTAKEENEKSYDKIMVDREVTLRTTVNSWDHTSTQAVQMEINKRKIAISGEAFRTGLLEHSEPWKNRWKTKTPAVR